MVHTLYLTGIPDPDHPGGNRLLVPAPSLILIFTLEVACPESSNFNIVCVDDLSRVSEQLNGSGEKQTLFPIDLSLVSFDIFIVEEGEVPSMVHNTTLPSVFCPEDNWCVVGMSSAVRHILQQSSELEGNDVAKKLLGFRGGCLQSCSEVSCWTKYCEIEMPTTLTNVYGSQLLKEFPQTVLRFNHHMSCPPILHNALKRKQEHIRKTVKDKTERERLLSLKLHELPDLDHNYAEALDLTLADVMLLVCFELVLHKLSYMDFEKHSPLVLKWLQLIKNIDFISRALKLLDFIKTNTLNVESHSKTDIVIPDFRKETFYQSDPDKMKLFDGVSSTSQQNISSCISILEDSQICVNYSEMSESQSRPLPWHEYPPSVHPQEGELPKSRLERKCQQLSNVVNMVLSVARDGDHIVDFCAGGGHVGIVVAYRRPGCKVLLVENKLSSLLRARKRVEALQLSNVEFYQCNLDYFIGSFDVGVCLHACGQATDLVLQKCFDQGASFVCSPCCYGAIQPNHNVSYPRSENYRTLLPSIQDYLHLGHGADQTHGPEHPSTPQGQLCMRLIDGDRLAHASQLGYTSDLYLMTPVTCSPKNHILVGVRHKERS